MVPMREDQEDRLGLSRVMGSVCLIGAGLWQSQSSALSRASMSLSTVAGGLHVLVDDRLLYLQNCQRFGSMLLVTSSQ